MEDSNYISAWKDPVTEGVRKHEIWWYGQFAWAIGKWMALVALPLVAHWPALGSSWHLDDYGWVLGNERLDGTLWEAMSTHGDGQEFLTHRPLVWAVLWGIHRLWVFDPTPVHAVALGYHVMATLVAFCLLRELATERVAWAASLLWSVHPITTAATAYAVQVSVPMAAFWTLAFCWCVLEGRVLLAVVSLGMALGSRETGILAGPLALLCLWLRRARWTRWHAI